MSPHQIIYTSCRRGINGVNDGQQVFSYDASFKDSNNDEVKSLFSYQPPVLEPGVVMTEEIAPTLPKSFTYRKLDNGACALALNTYLGRDYMGSAGRFGNHLSHVVLADESDMQNYPCEFYGSSLLRDCMEFEEVNNPDRPDYLLKPVFERGFTVDVDAVIDFLNVDDRIEIFKNMLFAVFAFKTERKRVVICDDPKNIIMWIAAIEYALPLKTALGINFSTYDFDPSLSSSQICGVIPKGSRYTAESQRLHFVFDLYEKNCAEFEKDEHYFDFIDTSMSFSYDSLQDFHLFITKGYNYDKADEKMYSAYRLYSLMSDGIAELTENEIKTALDFASEYALSAEVLRVLQSLFEKKDYLLETNIRSFLCIMRYAISKYELLSENYRAIIKGLMVDRVLYEFLNNESGENTFVSFYDKVDSVCRESGFSVATELMRKSNREKLFAVMQNDIATWKISFVIKVVSTFGRDQQVSVNELLIDSPLGQTYYGLVQAVYSKNTQNGYFLVTRILDEFSNDCKYLVNMALNIEGMLFDLPNGNQEVASMWKYFGQTMVKYQQTDFATAYSILGDYKRYEQIYMLYSLAMSNATGLAESQLIFNDHYKTYVTCDRNYLQQYSGQIMIDYYRRLESFDSESIYSAKIDLFDIVSSEKMEVSFAESLVKDIVRNIPLESPSKDNDKLIQTSYEYLYNNLCKPISGKLLLLVIASVLEKCKKSSQLHDAFESLERLISDGKADMSKVTEHSAKKYFDWLLPEVCELCEKTSDIESLYNLFEMPRNISSLFFVPCAKIYLKQSKDDKDYGVFCKFLGLVFEKGNPQIREEIGKVLCKLSKQKLSDLDKVIKDIYHDDRTALRYWNVIKDVAESTSPILNNISNLFKRKKD
ncbi:MAG: hypothetical protein GX896_05150 [Clostridiales bacterium]|nr:hypothetical protein [Clostridiales bacterium]